MITGSFGKYLGIPYLFLDPEYLNRVGLDVELAADGVECTEMVFGRGRGFVRFGELPGWDGLNRESPCGRGVGGEGAVAHLPV